MQVTTVSATSVLRATRRLEHSRSTLFSHLTRTARLLSAWGADRQTVCAGLYHSVYGTQYFDFPLLSLRDRSTLRTIIGEGAEYIVYAFCTIDRTRLWKAFSMDPTLDEFNVNSTAGRRWVKRRTVLRLLEIEAANWVEQILALNPFHPWMSWVLRLHEQYRCFNLSKRLTFRPLQEEDEEVALHIVQQPSAGPEELRRALTLNPTHPELGLRLAKQLKLVGDVVEARDVARAALLDLKAWGACTSSRNHDVALRAELQGLLSGCT